MDGRQMDGRRMDDRQIVIQLKIKFTAIAYNKSKNLNHLENKRSWGKTVKYIWGTFDPVVFNVMLGSFGALFQKMIVCKHDSFSYTSLCEPFFYTDVHYNIPDKDTVLHF